MSQDPTAITTTPEATVAPAAGSPPAPPSAQVPPEPRPSRWANRVLFMLVPLLVALLAYGLTRTPARQAKAEPPAPRAKADEPEPPARARSAPELDGGTAYLNTAGPIRLKDLRGKIVILDFWTLCCINCIHILPDLAKLEKKYPNEFVVIGVHSPKFENEKDTASIRKAILRYEISHPVINDAEHEIWDRYDVESWPTCCLIDPEGNYHRHGIGRRATIDAPGQGHRRADQDPQGEENAEREADQVRAGPLPGDRGQPAVLPGQGPGRCRRASGSSSPTARITAWS